jgi:hypothetical protein
MSPATGPGITVLAEAPPPSFLAIFVAVLHFLFTEPSSVSEYCILTC